MALITTIFNGRTCFSLPLVEPLPFGRFPFVEPFGTTESSLRFAWIFFNAPHKKSVFRVRS